MGGFCLHVFTEVACQISSGKPRGEVFVPYPRAISDTHLVIPGMSGDLPRPAARLSVGPRCHSPLAYILLSLPHGECMTKKTDGLRYEPLYKLRAQRPQAGKKTLGKGWRAFWRRMTRGLLKGSRQ
jgi:hypothetical protein